MRNFALRTAVLYFIAGAVWIILSDRLLELLVPKHLLVTVSSFKGIFFVLVTSAIVFLLLSKYVKRIRENETQYRGLFRNHPQSLWIYNMRNLKFIAINNTTLKKFGHSIDEFLQMTMLDVLAPSELRNLDKYAQFLKSDEQLNGVVVKHKDKAGHEFFMRLSSHAVNFDGVPARLVMAADADAEKRAETELNVTESKLNALLNNSDDLIWLFDETGAIITFNRAFEQKFKAILGIALPHDFPIRLEAQIDNPIIARMLNNFKRAASGEHLRIEEEFFNQETKQKEYYEVIKSPIYAEGKFIGVGCFAREITDRIISQQEIEERITQLKEIAWIQSHEVRRPLANIMGLVELIKLNASNKQQTDEAVQLLQTSAAELDDIIREVIRKTGNIK